VEEYRFIGTGVQDLRGVLCRVYSKGGYTMSRLARKHQLADSLIYHVYNRGNGKSRIFHDEDDFHRFFDRLREYSADYCAKIYHWVFMLTHFHLVLELPEPERLPLFMAQWLGGYARYYIRKYESAGHVWQGRFCSQPIQKESYLLRCGRYVERNAMRAGMVVNPWDYRWSSCRVYATSVEDGLTSLNPFYRGFGITPEERKGAYRKWLMEGEEEIFSDMSSPVGEKHFKSLLSLKGSRLVARRNGRPLIQIGPIACN
jgi:putative transposase